jgi:hypothetical protein
MAKKETKDAVRKLYEATGEPIREGLVEVMADLFEDPQTEWFPSLRKDGIEPVKPDDGAPSMDQK